MVIGYQRVSKSLCSDHYSFRVLETDCASFPKLAEAINEGHFLVPALLPEQIRETIELPPRLFDGEVEEALVNQLLNDIDQARHSDQLPLLQYVLMRMWVAFSSTSPWTTNINQDLL
jgi:hypothetical protein